MDSALSILLVHSDERERARLRTACDALEGVQIVGERADLRAGMAVAHQLRPSILVLELNGNAADVISAAGQYRLENPDGAIFLSADALAPELLMQAMRAGAQEVLRRPLDREALAAAVDRVSNLAARKRDGVARVRKVVTVFSPKGGVGVTTLATHLAASLARQTRSRVAIADFDGQGAAVAASMGMNPARSFANLATVERIDSAALQDVIVRHPSGVAILAQPEGVEDAQSLDPERAAGVLEVLAGMHDHVVVDAPHVFDGVALEVFDRSSTVLLVTDLTVGGLRAARRALDVFRRLNYLVVRERVQLVVNRAVDRSAITPKQVEETLAYPVSHVITNDYNAVREAVDLGRVLCSEASSSRMARDVDAMARRLSGDETGEEPVESTPTRRTGLRLFGKR